MPQPRGLSFLASLLLVPLVASCAGGGPARPAQNAQRQVAVPVNSATVARGAIASTLTYSGDIQARAKVDVLPRATGRIDRLYVDVGSPVQAGDRIAVLDRTQLDAQVRQADGALRAAQAHLDLLLAGARPEDVASARAALSSAQSKLQQMVQGGRPEDVAAAQADLEAAQARMQQLFEGSTDAQIAAAQALVASTQASLQSGNERLAQLLGGGSPEDQRAADANVEAARGTRDQAVARRDALRNPPADQLQSARTDVESAQATLNAARERLAQVQAGGTTADEVSAQSAVDTARAAHQAAQESLAALLNGGAPSDRESAQAAYTTALSNWRAARARYDLLHSQSDPSNPANSGTQLSDRRQAVDQAQQNVAIRCGTTSTGTTGGIPPAASVSPDCAAAQGALDRANAVLSDAQNNQPSLTQRVSQSDIAAARSAVETADANLKAAQARIDQLNNPTPSDVAAARSAVDTAQSNLESALARQEVLHNPAPDTLATATGAVQSAEASLRAAREHYNIVVGGGSLEDQRAADAAVFAAQGALDQAVARRDALRSPSASDVADARAAVDTATANLASAQSGLADVQAGAKAADLQAGISAVDQAQQTLTLKRYPYQVQEIQQQQQAVAQARADLALRSEPNRPEDVQQARAAVEQAQGAYDLARAQADETEIDAPFTGVVSAKLMSEGALASPSTPVVTLVSPDVEVAVSIEEARIGQVPQGRPAVLVVSAYPDEQFQAVVEVVSPTADPRSRTFQAKVVPLDPSGKLREGMFAQVRIRGDERQDVVLIPNEAVVQRAGQTVAFVVADGAAHLRELQLGISDGHQTEVIAGLDAGDQLVVAGQETLNEGDAVREAPRAAS